MKDSTNLRRIKGLCQSRKLDYNEVYHKSKVLLSIYREVIYQTLDQIQETYDDISNVNSNFLSDDLDSAFTCFSNFTSDYNLDEFEARLISLTKTKLIIEIIDKTMFRVYNYPINGQLYHELLSKKYLVDVSYTENDILEIINLERSTYYRRKNEAILLFGISLWGYEASELKSLFLCKELAKKLAH